MTDPRPPSPWADNRELLKVAQPSLASRVGTPPAATTGTVSETDHEEASSSAKRLRESLLNPALLLVLGLGNIHTLLSYLRDPHPLGRRVLVIERHMERFRQAMQCADLTALLDPDRVTLWVEEPLSTLGTSLRLLFHERQNAVLLSAVDMIRSPDTTGGADKDYYDAAEGLFREALQHGLHLHQTNAIDATACFLQVVANMPRFEDIPDWNGLRGTMRGVPGIVVSTGPSLTRRLPELKKFQDHALIYAADSAWPILAAHGIRPHMVGVLERVPEVARYFSDRPADPDVHLVTNPMVFPKVLDLWKGPLLPLMRAMPVVQWFYPVPEHIYTGESVAHMGVALLHHLGCSSIVLAGQDLAYDAESGATHAKGMVLAAHAEDEAYRITETWLPGNSGGPVRSTTTWMHFGSLLTDMVHAFHIPCVNWIEPNVGARIDGVPLADPATFTLPETGIDVRRSFSETVRRTPRISVGADALKRKTVLDLDTMITALSGALRETATTWDLCRQTGEHPDFDAMLSAFVTSLDAMTRHWIDDSRIFEHLLYRMAWPRLFEMERTWIASLASVPTGRKKNELHLLRRFDMLAWVLFWARYVRSVLARPHDRTPPTPV